MDNRIYPKGIMDKAMEFLRNKVRVAKIEMLLKNKTDGESVNSTKTYE